MAGDAKITVDEFNRVCAEGLPAAAFFGFLTEEIGAGTARVRLPASSDHIRPGGTISGPAQMALADITLYAALLGAIGEVPLAVTTNLNINFLRKPEAGDLLADCRLLKVGKRLAMGEVSIFSPGRDEPVAHVTATYSIPPNRPEG